MTQAINALPVASLVAWSALGMLALVGVAYIGSEIMRLQRHKMSSQMVRQFAERTHLADRLETLMELTERQFHALAVLLGEAEHESEDEASCSH